MLLMTVYVHLVYDTYLPMERSAVVKSEGVFTECHRVCAALSGTSKQLSKVGKLTHTFISTIQ